MRRGLIAAILALTLIASFLLPALPVSAGPPDRVPPGQLEKLEKGWRRLDSSTKAHQIGKVVNKGREETLHEAVITILPETMPDGITLIDTNWYLLQDNSGQQWFQNGINYFTAKVLGGRVSVADKSGKLSVWDSSVKIGGTTYSGGTPVIVRDPLNPNYSSNTLEWDYGTYSRGFLGLGGSVPIVRYLRNIQGHIGEIWILNMDLGADVVVNLHETTEPGTTARTEWVSAFDKKGKPLKVTKTALGTYFIRAEEFRDKTYPVTIDPTLDFTTSSYDGFAYSDDASYVTARTQESADWATYSTSVIPVGMIWDGFTYYIARLFPYFDTSSIPDNANISASALYLFGNWDMTQTDFNITVQSGMPTCPNMPLTAADYSYLHYSGTGGQLTTVGFSVTAFNVLNLTPAGISWINKAGWTKFILRSNLDIAGTVPTDYQCVGICSYDYGLSYAPEMRVTYSIPVTLPSVTTLGLSSKTATTITVVGLLGNDGGEASSVRFSYGPTSALGYSTAWTAGYVTGQQFSTTLAGLLPGTTYYYRAEAMNSAGTGYGTTSATITYPSPPTNFTATDGENQVVLTWTKGTGANKTMIRRSTTGYPTTVTDGTQVYFDTDTSYNNSGTAGTTYYYSAWSYAENVPLSLGEYSLTYVTDYAAPYTLGLATVTTNDATAIGISTATLNLYLSNLGGYASADVNFQWYKNGQTQWGNDTTPTNKTAPGSHSAGLSGLDASSLYYFRAKAVNTAGTSYGASKSFTTGGISAPTMTTQSATGLQLSGATLNGVVTANGGASVTAWFEWGLTTSYGTSTPSISGLTTSDTFYYGLTGLEPNTTYHYRAVGQNTGGIGYGADQSFATTSPSVPAVRTDAASYIGANQAQLNGTVLTDGGVTAEVRFQYGLTISYSDNTTWVAGYSAAQSFNKLITGLTIGETYHFRAQAKNPGGTASGSDATFTTVFGPPQDFRAKAISSTTINLNWVKQGDQTHIRYKTSGYPVDRLAGIAAYTGPLEYASVSGLTAGTTYYFRTWSWREGDVWSDECTDDVATTQATIAAGEEPTPPSVLTTPEEPSSWRQEPSGTLLTKLPFYSAGVAFAESYEIPEGTFWFLGAMVIIIIAGLVAGIASGGNVIATTIVGGFALLGCVGLGMVTGWFILGYAILGGGLMYLLKGGSVT